MAYANTKTHRHLVKGRLLLGGLAGQGRLRGDHAQARSDVLGLCLNGMDRRLSVGVGLRWLLLKVLEHLLKLKMPVTESERRVISESLRDVQAMIIQAK